MRTVFYILGGVVALVIAAALVVPMVVDVNDYKDEIVAEARRHTGRDLAIDGPIRLAILPSPALTAEGVRFANAPGSDEPDMARIGSLQVSVAAIPLLTGTIDVTRISLVGARIVVETLPDGTPNWVFAAPDPSAGVPQAPAVGQEAGEPSKGQGRQVAIRDFTIEDGTLVWRDGRSGNVVQLDRINARLQADSLQGPFDLRAAFEARGQKFTAELRGGLPSAAPQPARLVLGTPGGQLRFSGTVAEGPEGPALEGQLTAEGDSLAALAQALAAAAGQEPPALPPAFARKFTLQTEVAGDPGRISATDIKLTLGADSGQGEITATLGASPRADVTFAFPKLDFDQLLAASAGTAPAAAGADRPASAAPAASPASGSFLNDAEGSVDLSVGTIVYQGRTAQQIVVRADLSQGVLTLHELGGQFPGNTVIAAAGTVDASKAQPAGDGKIEIRSARLREFLAWLDIDVSRVPADRLNALSFAGQIAATAEGNVQIANAVAQIDSTTARGAVTLRTSPRLGVVADLDVDTINVDAYLPKPAAGKPASGGQSDAGAAGAGGLDATVKARIARLTYEGNQFEGIAVDATMSGDRITFRPSRIASAAGANLAWNGSVSGYTGTPSVDLTVDVRAPDADRLLRIAGVAPPTAQRLGAATASGRISGKLDDLTFHDFALGGLGSTVRLTGRLGTGPQGPSYNFSRLDLRSDDVDRLLSVLGLGAPLPGRKLGALTVAGAAQGNASQATVDLNLTNQGARVELKGTVGNLKASPTLAMTVGLSHPDFQRFMALLQPGYGGGRGVGAIAFSARVDGSPDGELRITNLRGNLGQAPISGNITANLAAPVPDFAVALETGTLEIDRILPLGDRAQLLPELRQYPPNVVPASGGTQIAQAASRSGRFARTPIDVSALRSANVRLDLRSQALSIPPWRVENAVAQADLRAGVLTISQLAGRAFDGDFSLTGVVNGSRLPASINASLRASQIDMNRLSRALAQKDRFDGRMNLALDMTGSGGSEAEIVSSLNGNGNLGGRVRVNTSFAETAGGLLAGQAARQVDRLLGNLTGSRGASIGGGDINAAINIALSRFANRDGDASGTLAIRNGVVTSRDLLVIGNRARAETTMTANLPAWTLDATTNILLEENPQQPYLVVVNRGPLDNPSVSVSRTNVRAREEPAAQQQAPQQQVPQQQPQVQEAPPAQQQQQKPSRPRLPNLRDLLRQR